jgi:phosphoribosylglycinamide formyltransferase-1
MASADFAETDPAAAADPHRCLAQGQLAQGQLAQDQLAQDQPAMIKKRVAILISGRGSNMAALIAAAGEASFPAEIALVLSNRPTAAGLAVARAAGIKTAVVDHTLYRGDREAFERAMQAGLEAHRVDLICLAGFMRLLTPWFLRGWPDRLINIHPALLPAFKGLKTHERALAAGVKIHGASVHFVVPEMDSGPIIAQGAVAVHEGDSVETLASRVLAIEHRLYPVALALLAAGRVRIIDGRCQIEGARAADGYFIVPQNSDDGGRTTDDG